MNNNQNMNLFWKQAEKLELKEADKENNVTHALLVLLNENNHFLNLLLKKINPALKINQPKTYFQVSPKLRLKTAEVENKIILSITSNNNTSEKFEQENIKKKRDIPDGLILDKKTAVLIEAKVSATKDHEQLKRYNKTYYYGKGNIYFINWEEIYNLAKNYQSKGDKNIENYLLNQFREYLEVINLSGFSGINFFNKEENYDEDSARDVLKRLVVELKQKDILKQYNFKFAERPLTGNAWNYFYSEGIKENNPRIFPHYSIYIFPEFFGLDCLFHKKEFKKILKEKDYFFSVIENLAKKSPDYYLKFTHYRKLANKESNKNVRVGPGYENFSFMVQIRQYIKDNKKDWKERLEQYFNLLTKEHLKQISILKKTDYKDKANQNMNEPEKVIEFITSTVSETNNIYKKMVELYK